MKLQSIFIATLIFSPVQQVQAVSSGVIDGQLLSTRQAVFQAVISGVDDEQAEKIIAQRESLELLRAQITELRSDPSVNPENISSLVEELRNIRNEASFLIRDAIERDPDLRSEIKRIHRMQLKRQLRGKLPVADRFAGREFGGQGHDDQEAHRIELRDRLLDLRIELIARREMIRNRIRERRAGDILDSASDGMN